MANIQESEFPKIIHQIYGFWDKTIPKNIKNRMDTWKKLHPNYQYILWDKKKSREFIKKNYNWFLQLYDNYPYHVQRADALRYFILYYYGGIYSDIDLEPVKPIDPILEKYKNKSAILYRSANSGLITNDFMISKPKNNFWKKVWNEMLLNYNFSSLSRHLIVMYSTGPLLLDSVYENYTLKKKQAYIINSKYINNCDLSEIKPCYNKEAFLKRYEGNSWHSFDSTFFNFFYTYYKIILIIFVIIVIFLIIILEKK